MQSHAKLQAGEIEVSFFYFFRGVGSPGAEGLVGGRRRAFVFGDQDTRTARARLLAEETPFGTGAANLRRRFVFSCLWRLVKAQLKVAAAKARVRSGGAKGRKSSWETASTSWFKGRLPLCTGFSEVWESAGARGFKVRMLR